MTPEEQAELADSMGLALLVVLEMLSPAERISFVLHDMFSFSFDEVAQILGSHPRPVDSSRVGLGGACEPPMIRPLIRSASARSSTHS